MRDLEHLKKNTCPPDRIRTMDVLTAKRTRHSLCHGSLFFPLVDDLKVLKSHAIYNTSIRSLTQFKSQTHLSVCLRACVRAREEAK